MPWLDILSPAIVIAVVVLLWRDTNSRIMALGRMVADVDRRLSAAIADIDRQLTTLEGRITGWQNRRNTPAAPGE